MEGTYEIINNVDLTASTQHAVNSAGYSPPNPRKRRLTATASLARTESLQIRLIASSTYCLLLRGAGPSCHTLDAISSRGQLLVHCHGMASATCRTFETLCSYRPRTLG